MPGSNRNLLIKYRQREGQPTLDTFPIVSRPMYRINAGIADLLKKGPQRSKDRYKQWLDDLRKLMKNPPPNSSWPPWEEWNKDRRKKFSEICRLQGAELNRLRDEHLSIEAICGFLPLPDEFLRRMDNAQSAQAYSESAEGQERAAAFADLRPRKYTPTPLTLSHSSRRASLLDSEITPPLLAPMSPVLPPQPPNPRLNPGPALGEDAMWPDLSELHTSSDHALAKAHRRITRRTAERYGTTPEEFQAGRTFR